MHRDLKPENIFITQKHGRDFVKVLDFGISKIKNPEHGDPKLTATDQIVGTPLYISPELARGIATVDHRTDIYALGVIMYEMLTGSPPFTGENHFQLLYKHGNEAPDPPSQRSKKASIPPHVESAVLRALEKNPDDRFDSMNDFSRRCAGPTVPRRAADVRRSRCSPPRSWRAWRSSCGRRQPRQSSRSRRSWRRPTCCDRKVRRPRRNFANRAGRRAGEDRASTHGQRGAFVALNGEKRGRTPLTLELERGRGGDGTVFASGIPHEEHRLVPSEDDAARGAPREEIPSQATSD